MRTKQVVGAATLVFATLLLETQAFAHHSLETQFDQTMPISLRGTVTKVTWDNPHVRFFIEVKDRDGSVMKWTLEMGSPNQQFLRGWKIDTFRRGDPILVQAYPARDGSNLAYAKSVNRTTPLR